MARVEAVDWKYLAEGNANVIFSYVGSNATFQGCVLRLMKTSTSDSYDTVAQYQWLQQELLPKIHDIQNYILHSKLVSIEYKELDILEGVMAKDSNRPQRFLSSSLNLRATHGLLLPDLSSTEDNLILEFKPKWLRQSPQAPLDATTCRTCAIRNMRKSSASSGDDHHCPMDLISREKSRIERAVRRLIAMKGSICASKEVDAVVAFLADDKLLHRLSDAQGRNENEESICLCMTLRDCSVYLVLDRHISVVTSAWLGDLDRKHPAKLPHWRSIERALLTGNYYHSGKCCLG